MVSTGAAPTLYSLLVGWQSSKQLCRRAQHEAPLCRCTQFANRQAELGGELPGMCTACVVHLHACSLSGTTWMTWMLSLRCCTPSELSVTSTHHTDALAFNRKHCVLHEEVLAHCCHATE